MKRALLPLVVLALLGVGCGGGGGTQAASPTGPTTPVTTPTPTPSPSPSETPPTPTCQPKGTTLRLTAQDISFSTDCLAVKAGSDFTVVFTNKDGAAHNVDITLEDGTSVFQGDLVTAKTISYKVKALTAGVYPFQCDVHPSVMQGTLFVQ